MKPGDYTEVAVTQGNQCPSRTEGQIGDRCNRPDGHPGEHADVSPTGLVLSVWGDPAKTDGPTLLTEARQKALDRLCAAWSSVQEAIDDAERIEWELRTRFKDDPLMTAVLREADLPLGLDWPVDPDNRDGWESELTYYAKKIGSAS
ncbi:hypothetical protein ACXYTP_25285 [Tsukamurella ocularis]